MLYQYYMVEEDDLKKFHILAQNKVGSIGKEYNSNGIENESQIKYLFKRKF
jgi:hypothetical protein